nr:GNAT family N-acetyltransferase [Roseococcus sp. MDT2-1-1]
MTVPCAWLLPEDAASLFVVADGPLCGIFDLAVRPEARRRGLARRIVAAGADWAIGQGCTHAYLQVSATNDASIALNTGMGFGESYRYRYLSPE